MNYYFLPGIGIYGGIKVGFQFCQMLDGLGIKIVVVTPDGKAPVWFRSSASVIAEEEAMKKITAHDTVIFSLPHDYLRLKKISKKLVFHCQGTDPLIDPILLDHEVTLLNCWQQAKDYMLNAGRESISVGISIADAFFYDGTLKDSHLISFMSRRGKEVMSTLLDFNHDLTVSLIDGMHQEQVATTFKESTFFVATSKNEWFGLPALEAMASGCVVLSVPVVGGTEYLKNEQNCFYGEAEFLKDKLKSSLMDNLLIRELQFEAVNTALYYTHQKQANHLKMMLSNQLHFLVH
jgi:hypothetical protein